MQTRAMLLSALALGIFLAGAASSADASGDAGAYRQKMHDCTTQMKTDHPDMNHAARRKECRSQLGAAPAAKSGHTVPATSTPPGTPPATPTTPQTNP